MLDRWTYDKSPNLSACWPLISHKQWDCEHHARRHHPCYRARLPVAMVLPTTVHALSVTHISLGHWFPTLLWQGADWEQVSMPCCYMHGKIHDLGAHTLFYTHQSKLLAPWDYWSGTPIVLSPYFLPPVRGQVQVSQVLVPVICHLNF
jgi:hypothetical protein